MISALLFPNSKPARVLLYISENHELVFCDQNIYEFLDVIKRKSPNHLNDAETLLAELSYELIESVSIAINIIRDSKDQPILNAAINAKVDIIITGDKDFLSLDIEHPKCMTAAQFIESKHNVLKFNR